MKRSGLKRMMLKRMTRRIYSFGELANQEESEGIYE